MRGPAGIADKPLILSRTVLAALLLCGPVLTAVFWWSLSLDSRFPYRELDLLNGTAAAVTAAGLLGLGIAVCIRRASGTKAPYVSWVSAMWLIAFAAHCSYFAAISLVLGPACSDENCMYEIGQIYWWLLWIVGWLVASFGWVGRQKL